MESEEATQIFSLPTLVSCWLFHLYHNNNGDDHDDVDDDDDDHDDDNKCLYVHS